MTARSDRLESPVRLPCGASLPNRIAKAAMTEGLSADGLPDIGHERLYRAWSRCGAGMMLTGNVQIARDHLERPGNVVLDGEPDARTRAAFTHWAAVAREGGARIWMQLSHAGRQTPSLINPHPHAPSAVALDLAPGRFGAPREMAKAEIERVIAAFARAARVARECGFDGVQIHAAHGYLISTFLSPKANRRGDRWGGPLENRARLLLRTIAATRAAVGADFPISAKLNSADFQQGGFDFEESVTLAGWLADAKVDLLEISGGNYEQPSMMGLPGGPPMRFDAGPGGLFPRFRQGHAAGRDAAVDGHRRISHRRGDDRGDRRGRGPRRRRPAALRRTRRPGEAAGRRARRAGPVRGTIAGRAA